MATKSMDVLDLKRTNSIKPNGVYQLRVESAETKNGNKGLLLMLRLRFVGQTGSIFQSVPVTGDGSFMYDAFLDAIEAPANGKMKVSELRGKNLWAKVYSQTYNEQESNKIKQFLKPALAAQLKETEEVVAAAGERLRGDPGLEADVDFATKVKDDPSLEESSDPTDDDGFPI